MTSLRIKLLRKPSRAGGLACQPSWNRTTAWRGNGKEREAILASRRYSAATTGDLSFRNEEFQGRKIIAQIAAVAGKQPVCVNLRVCADQEISDNAAFSANTLHIRSKNFPGQQRALARAFLRTSLRIKPRRDREGQVIGGQGRKLSV